jgi:hypothetical protein
VVCEDDDAFMVGIFLHSIGVDYQVHTSTCGIGSLQLIGISEPN